MKFTVESVDIVIDKWLRIFEVLSLLNFNKFQDHLKYMSPVTTDLTRICKDFSISVLNVINIMTPEKASMNLYDAALGTEKILQIWQNSIERLGAISFAEEVFLWGESIISLADHYTVKNTNIYEWDLLLSQWSKNNKSDLIPEPALELTTLNEIRKIVQFSEIKQQTIRNLVSEEMESNSNNWDSFLYDHLKIGSWINNTAAKQITVDKWQLILSILNTNELKILDNWGYELMKDNSNVLSLKQISVIDI